MDGFRAVLVRLHKECLKMDTNAIKKFIAEKVPQGYSLSKIQDMLKEQNVNITFMELRLLASEIESDVWKATEAKTEAEQKKEEPAAAEVEDDASGSDGDSAEGAADADQAITGKTTVEVSPIARPGAVASGSVKFGSGVTAEWMLDQYGRSAEFLYFVLIRSRFRFPEPGFFLRRGRGESVFPALSFSTRSIRSRSGAEFLPDRRSMS